MKILPFTYEVTWRDISGVFDFAVSIVSEVDLQPRMLAMHPGSNTLVGLVIDGEPQTFTKVDANVRAVTYDLSACEKLLPISTILLRFTGSAGQQYISGSIICDEIEVDDGDESGSSLRA